MKEKEKDETKVAGGIARAAVLSVEERKNIARKGAAARWKNDSDLPASNYPGIVKIGDMQFPCSVLSDGTRILTQSDFMTGMGMYYSGWVAKNRSKEDAAAGVPHFLAFKTLEPFIHKHLGDLQSITMKYRTESGAVAHGIKAEIIPKICEIWLDADAETALGTRQKQIAKKAQIIIRALAHVGIVSLVDEATGYQKVRAKDALAKILEQFIAKELQPWVHTFTEEFYEQLFRLRGLEFPRDSVRRPPYFGHLTNNIVYARLAPKVLEELKKETPRGANGRHSTQLHRRLTQDVGHPKLKEHLHAVTSLMKISSSYAQFEQFLDVAHPKFNHTLPLFKGPTDDGKGL